MRRAADHSYRYLQSDPSHPSLHFKRIGPLWSARVGLHHRALAVDDGDDTLGVWIGSHAEYDRLVRSRS